eukprot:scaffold300832_cov32-Tisochrysis_lutea.AAC.5
MARPCVPNVLWGRGTAAYGRHRLDSPRGMYGVSGDGHRIPFGGVVGSRPALPLATARSRVRGAHAAKRRC